MVLGCAQRGLARGCGVPALASAAFDKVGGMIFVPMRYATPHVPEFGLPSGAAGCWFGEAGITVERGVREAAGGQHQQSRVMWRE